MCKLVKLGSLLRGHSLMTNFVEENYTDGPEGFDKLDEFIESMEITIGELPEDIRMKIRNFIDEEISPLVFDEEIIFSKSNAVWEANDYNINEEKEVVKMISAYYSVIFALLERIDNFLVQLIQTEVANSDLSYELSDSFQEEV